MSNQSKLSVPGMKCAGCVDAIEKVLNDSGVTSSKADLESKTVVVEAESPVSELISTIKTIGFEATEVT